MSEACEPAPTILIDLSTATLYSDDQLIAEIWVSTDKGDFPSERWSDFVSPILSWWARELGPLLTNRRKTAKLMFMEGPHSIKLSKLDGAMVLGQFCNSGRAQFSRTFALQPFALSVAIACESVRDFYVASGHPHSTAMADVASSLRAAMDS